MLISLVPVFAEDANSITAYVSVTKYGEVLNDKAYTPMAYVPVELSGKESYNLDDVFTELHNLYYEGGSEVGYASANGDWGLSVTKLWGDTSGNFGYQVNGGTEYVSGLSHEVENGDYVDAVIYQNYYPDTESYAKFDKTDVDVIEGKPFDITLYYVSGYDENWNMVFSPCDNATITINGEETEYKTNENGKASITLDTAGTKIISAKKSKLVDEEEVPAITAPVCVASVSQHPAVTLIHNIAKMYVESDLTQTSTNLPWIIADLMIYEKLYSDSENKLSDTQKQAYLDKLISDVKDTKVPGDMAKTIIALRSMGYDPRNVYTSSLEKVDVVGRLAELVENKDASVVNNEYTLPYVMVALEQSEDYITEEQRKNLIDAALSLKGNWQSVSWGTDALTPMLLALAPYYDNNADVKSAVDESVEILKGEQRAEDGMIDGWSGYEGASTALAICGLSALGINADEVKTENSEYSLIDGMLADVNDTKDGFSNAFATEQGFRGLLAWRLITDGDGRDMYDFSDYPAVEAYATWASGCPVTFEVTPSDATVSVDGAEPVFGNMYDLAEGTYTYTVSKSGYNTKTGEIIVTSDDIENHTPKKVVVSLSESSSGSGSGTKISVSIKVMIHDGDKCDGLYTYKNNSSKYTALVSETITAEKGVTVFDVLDEALTKNKIEYIEGSEGYISSINGLAEFDHGKNSGWMFSVDGKHVNVGCRAKKLNSSSEVVWFYTDNYTKEKGSESWSSASSGGITNNVGKTENNSVVTTTKISGEKATVTATESSIKDAISAAEKNNNASVVIAPTETKNATNVTLEIPANSVKEIAGKEGLTLSVETNAGNVDISNEALNAIAEQIDDGKVLNVAVETKTADDISESAETVSSDALKNASIVEITITSGGTSIRTFGGNSLSVDVPVNENTHEIGKTYKVYIISADGSVDTSFGKCTEKDGKLSVNVQTKHLSTFVVTDVEAVPFTDVSEHWASDAIEYAYNHSIMQGVSENEFAPDDTMTRAMLVTVLYRLENPTEKANSNSFTDVEDGDWYADAVSWAAEKGIVNGVSETEFAPNTDITREQMSAVLYRYAQYKEQDTSVGEDTNILSYTDAEEISEYAIPAMQWMVGAGFMKGETESTINPQNNTTRAQVATILMRYIEL